MQLYQWAALRDFFQLPWFQRVWIVQEYVVSKDVVFVYGQQTYASTFPGSLLEAIMRHGLAWLLDRGEGDSEEARIARTKIRWLTRFRSAERHYQGLPGLTTKDDAGFVGQKHLAPSRSNYALQRPGLLEATRTSSPVMTGRSQTYLQTFRYFINTGQPEFLYATGEPRQLPGLSLWVPDWSTPKATGTLAKNTIQRYRSSDGCDYINFRLSPDLRALTCRGEIVDSISSFSSLFQFAKDPTDWTEIKPWFTETEAITTRSMAVTSGDSILAEVHYRTLVANQANVLDFTIDSYYAFKECIQFRGPDESIPRRTTLPFFTAMSYPAIGRKYGVTKDGTVGLVPSGTQEGDEICVFLGLVVALCHSQGFWHR
jgi:hypothetical protein